MSKAISGGKRRWSISRLDIPMRLIGMALIVAAIFLGLAIVEAREARRVADGWKQLSYEVISQTQKLSIALQDAEIGSRGYLLTGDEQFLAQFNKGAKAAPREIALLKKMTRDNATQQNNIGELAPILNRRLEILRKAIEDAVIGDEVTALQLAKPGQGFASMSSVQSMLTEINRVEGEVLRQRVAQYASATRQADILSYALLVLIVGMVAYGVNVMIAATRSQLGMQAAETERDLARQLHEADEAAVRGAAIVSAIGDTSPDLIFAKDREGRITYANPSTLAMIGLPPVQLIGRLTVEYNPDAVQAAAIDANDLAVMEGGVTKVIDERFSDPQGQVRLFRSTKTPLRDGEGNVIGLAGISVDVTAERTAVAALKASEERFRTLSETAPAFIFMANEKGEVTYTNSAFQKFTGKSNEELLGVGWVRTVHRDDRSIPEKAWADAVANGTPFSAEYRFCHHDGTSRWFLVRATHLRDASGQITQWIGTCSDIQDAIDARQAVEALNEGLEAKVAERTAELNSALETLQLEVAEREKAEAQVRHMQKIESIGQLTGGIAHDFNNMLAVVLGSLEIAKRRMKTDPDRAMAGIENAEEGARRAAVLTSRLLAFSRQQPLAPEPVDANKLVSRMSELLRQTLGEQIEIETVLAGGLWKTHIDPPQLENAILNLCVNARDAMPEGGKLTIETHNCRLDEGYSASHPDVVAGQYVLVGVTDTGTGMSPEIIERAFDPFYTTKEVGKGTGLGLSQVHGFVKQSGGHITIYSEQDEGTTVKIYLPRYFGEADEIGPSMSSAQMPVAQDGEVVLVVEDETQVRQVSTELLRDLGYGVIEAVDGADALKKLADAGRVDLIFTDIVMPGMTGRVMADEAAKQRENIKVLYTTGYTRNAVVHNGKLDPGTEFIAKPYSGAALAAKVRSVLDKR